MKPIRSMSILGALVAASLLISAPSQAKGRIAPAQLHRVTQITVADVVVGKASVGRDRSVRVSTNEYGRRVLLPNPDAGRRVVLPNPDAGRRMVLPNPDAQ